MPDASILKQLDALESIAKIDATTRKVEQEIQEVPARLADLKRDVERVEEMLAREHHQVAEAEDLKRKNEGEAASHAEVLSRSRAKAAGARNTREHDASQRELETLRRLSSERDDELLKLMGILDELRGRIASHEQDLAKLRDLLTTEQANAETRLAELRAERDRAATGRQELAAVVDKLVLRRYDQIRGRRGDGLAEAKDGTCMGCRMSIAPQLYNTIQRLISIEQCPFCQRTLIWRPPPPKD
ncbi:MAG: hypothetical protein IT379_03685 [Deltaproteobacteria bacterium]|nr:hypothetical protein [Deltaproteobacteria bacterium]